MSSEPNKWAFMLLSEHHWASVISNNELREHKKYWPFKRRCWISIRDRICSTLCCQISGTYCVGSSADTVMTLSMGSANERWRYIVTSSLIGWAHHCDDLVQLDMFISKLLFSHQWTMLCHVIYCLKWLMKCCWISKLFEIWAWRKFVSQTFEEPSHLDWSLPLTIWPAVIN